MGRIAPSKGSKASPHAAPRRRASSYNATAPCILQITAEVAIALTGFTGIVAALGRRADGPWSSYDLLRFQTLLTASLAALFFSLLPPLLRHSGGSSEDIWTAGSGLIALFMTVVVFLDVRSVRDTLDEIPDLDRRLATPIALIGFSVWSLQLANLFVLHALAPYLVALYWQLAFAAVMFVRLISGAGTESPSD